MKKTFFYACAIISLAAFSQNSPAAKALLDKVSKNITSYKNIEISFKQTLINRVAKINQSSNGKATLEGQKYLVNYLGNTILYDTKYTYVISPENEEVNITTAKNGGEEGMSPAKMLSFYKTGYTYAMDKKETVAGNPIQYIKLNPVKKNKDIVFILLGINTKTNRIHSLTEYGKNGTETKFEITSFKVNQTLAPTTFKFNRSKYVALDYIINN